MWYGWNCLCFFMVFESHLECGAYDCRQRRVRSKVKNPTRAQQNRVNGMVRGATIRTTRGPSHHKRAVRLTRIMQRVWVREMIEIIILIERGDQALQCQFDGATMIEGQWEEGRTGILSDMPLRVHGGGLMIDDLGLCGHGTSHLPTLVNEFLEMVMPSDLIDSHRINDDNVTRCQCPNLPSQTTYGLLKDWKQQMAHPHMLPI